MLCALGHCEDRACLDSSSTPELVRLFRCSIHCDRNLCLFHLNAHDVHYEEEKKQNDIIICELQNHLSLYQNIFEQQMISYRELVSQASTVLLHNTSSLVPIEQIRSILEKIQQAISAFQEEKVIIKCESTLNTTDTETEKIKNITNANDNTSDKSGQKIVLRFPRVYSERKSSPTIEEASENKPEQETDSPTRITRQTVDGMKKRTSSVKRLKK